MPRSVAPATVRPQSGSGRNVVYGVRITAVIPLQGRRIYDFRTIRRSSLQPLARAVATGR